MPAEDASQNETETENVRTNSAAIMRAAYFYYRKKEFFKEKAAYKSNSFTVVKIN